MKQASPKPPLCRVNLEVKQINAVFAQEFLFWASVKSKRKQRYLRYQLLVYWLLQQIDSLSFVLLITGANMLNQKSNLHDVVPTSDSSALEHVASNVATNVGTVITAPAPALEAQNAEEDSLPLFLTQAELQPLLTLLAQPLPKAFLPPQLPPHCSQSTMLLRMPLPPPLTLPPLL